MNSYLVESECAYVQQYVRAGLAETHMVVLAAIIRDLDRETAKSDSGKLLLLASWCVIFLSCLKLIIFSHAYRVGDVFYYMPIYHSLCFFLMES